MAIKINLEKVLKENNMTSKELCKKICKRCPIYNHQ